MSEVKQRPHWQHLRAMPQRQPYWRLLGITIDELGEGFARLRLPLEESVRNAGGPAHGGALASLVDTAVGVALDTLLDPSDPAFAGHTTVEMNVSFLEAAWGEALAEARIVRLGGSLAVGEAEIRDRQGRLVAVGRATYMIFRRR